MNNTENTKNNLNELKTIFNKDKTVTFREFCCKKDSSKYFCIVYVNGMIDKNSIHNQIIKPIIEADLNDNLDINQLLNTISNEVISAANVQQTNSLENIIQSLLTGNTVLFAKEFDKAIIIDTAYWDKRAITEPESEKTVTGPREGFTENMVTNIVLIRRKLNTPNLKLEFMELGSQTKTKICICYLENIADENIVKEVNKRLEKIDIDGVLDSEYLQELIKDAPMTPFKTTGYTERPDVVAGKLLEGRIAIICDGTPAVVTVPFIFVEYFNVNEDYYNNFYYATINRLMRWVGFFLATSIPALYLSLITYHQETLPTQFLLSISASRQNAPFPTTFEVLVMLFVFELIREASVRMPTVIGQTLSIVGALVIGQAAIEAKLISAPMVIVTALTGITSFIIPKMQGELIIIRLVFLGTASFMGLFGYLIGVLGMFIHLASLRSFGIPYMINLGTLRASDEKDVLVRAPWQKMKSRPKLVVKQNKQRAKVDKRR